MFRNCLMDLFFLYFMFMLGIFLFVSVLYYVEWIENLVNFKSILYLLWYMCVMMMIIG